MSVNLILGWSWITLGFVSGSLIGFNFRFLEPDWQGGYGSVRRRFYRLGHIAFFGLGLVNLLFYLSMHGTTAAGPLLAVASWALVIGAIFMPLSCFLIPHWPRGRNLFYLPVVSLIVGAAITLWEVLSL